jgi:hypothetical protein
MKQKWGREEHIELCSRNERNGLTWIKAGVWKLRGIRRGWEKGTCPPCRGNEDAKLPTHQDGECNLEIRNGCV